VEPFATIDGHQGGAPAGPGFAGKACSIGIEAGQQAGDARMKIVLKSVSCETARRSSPLTPGRVYNESKKLNFNS
jgi:hypothetical protein